MSEAGLLVQAFVYLAAAVIVVPMPRTRRRRPPTDRQVTAK
jgi:hypothetical protein